MPTDRHPLFEEGELELFMHMSGFGRTGYLDMWGMEVCHHVSQALQA